MALNRQVTRASLINKASVTATFAGETPEQIAKHRNIERRHQQLRKDKLRKDSACFPRFRVAEMRRLFVARHGEERLPDDDAGREYLRLVADHLGQIDTRLIRPWARQWMPTITPDELDELIASVGMGKRWKADALARQLGLDDATRTRLKIKTIGAIDCTKAQRKARRKRDNMLYARARRAEVGAKPHAQSASATQPWLKDGVCRRTWERRRAKLADVANSSAVHLVSSSSTNLRHENTHKRPKEAAERSKSATVLLTTGGEEHHGAEASTITAEPPLPSFRASLSSDQAKTDQIVALDNVAFRAAHLEHFQLLKVMQRSPEQKARLVALNGIIETERERRALRSLIATSPAIPHTTHNPPTNALRS